MKRALLVGIDEYEHSPLQGCVRDAERLGKVLERHENGDSNFSCKLLRGTPGARITRAVLRKHLEELFRGREADMALFYFAGHGIANDMGGFLVTQDAKAYDEGVPINLVLQLANRAKAHQVVVILDCCYSGALGGEPGEAGEQVALRDGVSLLTSTSDAQRAQESADGGLFTTLVCEALEGGAAALDGKVTIASVYAYVERALAGWDQSSLFVSHVSRLIELRKCTTEIDPAILRRLPHYFPTADYAYPLDPSYEPTAEPRHAEHEAIFGHLQRMRAARLLVPVGADHLYFAALESRSCRLTPLGKYYWKLAGENKL